jgi:hypothetical protein
MPREATALQVDFDAPEIVSEVYSDPLPTEDGDGEFKDSIVDMIEEERCPVVQNVLGTHLYLDEQNHCCYCGMAAPWVRRDACRS